MPTNQIKSNALYVCAGLGAIFVYATILYSHAINMPKWDDFPDILQFMDRWLNANTLEEKFSVFFYHTNEHILLVNHFIILAQYYLLGHIDFRWLIYTGNFFYLGSALILWLPFRNKDESAFAFAVIMLTAVSFYAYESTLWAMTAISNQSVIFFSLLTLWYATKSPVSPIRVTLFATLSIFSQSNGFLILPLVGIIFLFSDRKKLPVWLAFSALIIAFYAFMLDPASDQGESIEWGGIPLSHYGMAIPAFVALFGSTLFNEASIPALLVSFALGAAILFLSIKSMLARQHSSFILYALLFLGLCMASIAFYRGLFFGPSVVFISRYKMYAIYFLALGLLLSPQWLKACKDTPWKRHILLLFCLLFFSASFYLNLPKSTRIDGHLRESLEYWVEDGDFRRGKGYFIKDSDSYLFAALHRGVWSPLSLIESERIIQVVTLSETCPAEHGMTAVDITPAFRIKHINRNAPGIRVEILPEYKAPTTEQLVYLCGDELSYRLHLLPEEISPDVYSIYYIPAAHIAPGNYQIIAQIDGRLRLTNQFFLRKPHTR
jgi:hypothetical protein